MVLLAECRGHGVKNARAANQSRPNRDLLTFDLYCSVGFRPESPEPAGRLVVPGTHEYTAVCHDYPDARIPMGIPGADSDNFGAIQRLHLCIRQFLIVGHDRVGAV